MPLSGPRRNHLQYLLIAAILIVAGALFFSHLLALAKEAAAESACLGRLCQLSVAWSEYYYSTGHFVTREARSADGAVESWQESLGRVFHKIEKEDMECPSHSCSGAEYALVTGLGTVVQDDQALNIDDVVDGLQNTVVVFEVASFVPRDGRKWEVQIEDIPHLLERDHLFAAHSIHPLGRGMLFADGGIYRQVKPLTAKELRALMTAAGGEEISRDELVADGFLKFSGRVRTVPLPRGK